jgi:hypothetical protein
LVDPLRHALGIAVVAFAAGYALWLATRRTDRTIKAWAVASFFAHAAVGIAIWYRFPSLVANDAAVYEAQALGTRVANAGKEGFSVVLGGIYSAIGRAPVAGLILNALCMALLVVVVANTARRLGNIQAGRYAAILAAVLPPFLWWGSQLLREAPMWILLALAAETAVAIAIDGLSWRRAVWLLALCLPMLTIRAPVAAVVAVSLAVGLLFAGAPRSGDHVRRAVMIVGAIVLSALLFPRFAALQSLQEEDSASIVNSRNYLATANTGFGEAAAPTTYGLVGQLPSTLPLVTFGPLPWQLPSSGLPAVADTLSWWFVLYWAVRGFGPLYRRYGRAAWVLVGPASALIVVLALTLANFGIVIRMRAMVAVLLLPYAAIGLAVAVERRHAREISNRPVRVLRA